MSVTGHVAQLAEHYRHREFPGEFQTITTFAGGDRPRLHRTRMTQVWNPARAPALSSSQDIRLFAVVAQFPGDVLNCRPERSGVVRFANRVKESKSPKLQRCRSGRDASTAQ